MISDQTGFIMVLTLFFVEMFAQTILLNLSNNVLESKMQHNYGERMRAFEWAQSGVEWAEHHSDESFQLFPLSDKVQLRQRLIKGTACGNQYHIVSSSKGGDISVHLSSVYAVNVGRQKNCITDHGERIFWQEQ